jgi:small subunit ribosomal protein S15
MARMHTKKRGKAGSKRPSIKTIPRWVRYKKGEIEEIVVKLAKEGNSTPRIGLMLRDQYGIPSVKLLTGKTISQIMKDEKIYPKFPEDIFNLLKQSVTLKAHLEKNKADYTSKRGLELIESKIRRLGKYYVRRRVLPLDWKYDPEKVKLLVQQK